MAKKQKGGGARKIGRMVKKCELYRQEKRREKNKVKKLTKYLKNHPNNLVALEAMKRYQAMI